MKIQPHYRNGFMGRGCPGWVKLRRTQCEQMSSGLPLKADIAQHARHASKVPLPEVGIAAARFRSAPGQIGRPALRRPAS